MGRARIRIRLRESGDLYVTLTADDADDADENGSELGFLWFFFFVLFRVVSVVRGLDLKNLDPNAQE